MQKAQSFIDYGNGKSIVQNFGENYTNTLNRNFHDATGYGQYGPPAFQKNL